LLARLVVDLCADLRQVVSFPAAITPERVAKPPQCVPQDRHSHARVHVEGGQQRAARSPRVVNRDPADAVPGAPQAVTLAAFRGRP